MTAIRYEPVIGLEVHAQLATRTKLFCACAVDPTAAPNTHVCPTCLGLPGALPSPNRAAVELGARVGLALGCAIRESSTFARKAYFYPDLPKGYQITQLDEPLAQWGAVALEDGAGAPAVRVRRVHLEEDAAKSAHGGVDGDVTLVDFNRAGVPLAEIVSEPDLRSAQDAELYLRRLREVLLFAGASECSLEEGSFRCDANVSLRPVGQEALGVRTELKNINSFRFVRHAIEHELARQEAILAGGGEVARETRGWDARRERTYPMRGKEEAQDYRYFPDPDLPPLAASRAWVAAVGASMPVPAGTRRRRFVEDLGLTPYDAAVLTQHPAVADFFDAVLGALEGAARGSNAPGQAPAAARPAAKQVANFVITELLGHVATRGLSARFPLEPGRVAELLGLVHAGVIHRTVAKTVLGAMIRSGRRARAIVEGEGLAQVGDEAVIRRALEGVFEASPKQLAELRAGKEKLRGYFVGQVMRATGGRASPAVVDRVLDAMLAEG